MVLHQFTLLAVLLKLIVYNCRAKGAWCSRLLDEFEKERTEEDPIGLGFVESSIVRFAVVVQIRYNTADSRIQYVGSWNADDEGRLRRWTVLLQKRGAGGNVGNHLVNKSVVDRIFEKCLIGRTGGPIVCIGNDRLQSCPKEIQILLYKNSIGIASVDAVGSLCGDAGGGLGTGQVSRITRRAPLTLCGHCVER